jgi:hypothetical protein
VSRHFRAHRDRARLDRRVRASRGAIAMSTARADASASTRATTQAPTTAHADGGVSAAFALTLSVVSSVSLVIVNKHLISVLGFKEGASRARRARDARRADASERALERVGFSG